MTLQRLGGSRTHAAGSCEQHRWQRLPSPTFVHRFALRQVFCLAPCFHAHAKTGGKAKRENRGQGKKQGARQKTGGKAKNLVQGKGFRKGLGGHVVHRGGGHVVHTQLNKDCSLW